ncbi:hypothetical protein FOL47_000812 [Perkinsus chesapeaki]|uniref:Uncharacterized protein n=1 Tax=Perkinsus chesapeaki TaxID=330153 RepID=A0A7J6KW74_PERCH|nr:hypothetical protein FOL47_000812 [Perkinsus chesapeaki]
MSSTREGEHATGTLAFNVLDTLHRNGSLSRDEMEYYKVQYERLHKVVSDSYESEKELLKKAKELNIDLTKEMIKVEKASVEQSDDAAAIAVLRNAVGRVTAELQMTTEKEAVSMLQSQEASNDLVSVQEEMAEHEAYERGLLEPQEDRLKAVIVELTKKLDKAREEKDAIINDINRINDEALDLQEKVRDENDELMEVEGDLQRLQNEPQRVARDAERNAEMLDKVKEAIGVERKEIDKSREWCNMEM